MKHALCAQGDLLCWKKHGDATSLELRAAALDAYKAAEPRIGVRSSRFPFRAVRRKLETVIEDAATATPVARFPVPLDHISTFPNGRAWVGASANHVYIITLEGGEDSAKVKTESGKAGLNKSNVEGRRLKAKAAHSRRESPSG